MRDWTNLGMCQPRRITLRNIGRLFGRYIRILVQWVVLSDVCSLGMGVTQAIGLGMLLAKSH